MLTLKDCEFSLYANQGAQIVLNKEPSMLASICIFFALGVGTLLFVTDIFGYSAQVNEHIKDLKSGRALNKKERQELYYFKLVTAARIFALLCLLAGILLLAIYLLRKFI